MVIDFHLLLLDSYTKVILEAIVDPVRLLVMATVNIGKSYFEALLRR